MNFDDLFDICEEYKLVPHKAHREKFPKKPHILIALRGNRAYIDRCFEQLPRKWVKRDVNRPTRVLETRSSRITVIDISHRDIDCVRGCSVDLLLCPPNLADDESAVLFSLLL